METTKTKKPTPTFEFSFPTIFPAKPPFVQVFYEKEALCPVPFEMAERYSRFVSDTLSTRVATDMVSSNLFIASQSLFVVTLPSEPKVTVKNVQAVVEAMVNGRMKVPMGERLGILGASRLLKVDLLQKAVQDHLAKGCRFRPELKLQCLEATFAEPENDDFRLQRFKDARQHFYSIANSKGWVNLNVDIIRELLIDDVHLKVPERDLYLAVLHWLVSNPLQIPAHCDRLLGLIRFGSMSTEEKFKCMDEARCVGLDSFVKPYLIEADWYRTCHELNHQEFTGHAEFDRLDHFIGENRQERAIEAHKLASHGRKKAPGMAVTIETVPSSLERVQEGKIQGGTWMPRQRSVPVEVSSEKSSSSGSSGKSMKARSWKKRCRPRKTAAAGPQEEAEQ